MTKVEYEQHEIKILELTPEGKKYLEYNEKVGGKPFGYCVGGHNIDEKFGGIIGLYDYCISHNITWEKLLHYKYDANIII